MRLKQGFRCDYYSLKIFCRKDASVNWFLDCYSLNFNIKMACQYIQKAQHNNRQTSHGKYRHKVMISLGACKWFKLLQDSQS